MFDLGETTPKNLSILRIFSVILHAMKITGREQAADTFARFFLVILSLFNANEFRLAQFDIIYTFNASLRGVKFQISGTFSDRTWNLHKLRIRLPPTCQTVKAFTIGKTPYIHKQSCSRIVCPEELVSHSSPTFWLYFYLNVHFFFETEFLNFLL